MSCPDELTWSIYADGELEVEALRRVEMHLVSCRDCRVRVVALQDEATAITDALLERGPDVVRARERAVPPADLAWGLPAAIGAVALLLSVVGVLVELRLPGAFDLLDPRRWMGAYDMIFDSVFLLRTTLPGLYELGLSVGAVAAFSALGCAAVHALSQRLTRSSSSLLLGLAVLALPVIGLPGSARAVDLRTDQDTHVVAGERIEETLVCTGEVVIVDGEVDGDLVVGAERVTLRGTITGNVYAFAGELEIEGRVGGSVIAIGEDVRLGGTVDGSVTLGGERVTLGADARIARDATLFGDGARVDGEAARDVVFGGEWLEVRGTIGRDLHVFEARRITLLDGSRIGRDLRARLRRGEEAVEQAPQAVVEGEVCVEQRSIVRDHYLARFQHAHYYVMHLVFAAAAFVFGLLVYLLDPRLFEAETPDARGFFRALGTGFLAVLATPVVLVLLSLTVVGIPVAALGAFLLALGLYTAYVVVAALIGQLLHAASGPGLGRFAPSLLAGVLALGVVAALPFVGSAVRIVAVLFGAGLLIDRVRGLQALNLRGWTTGGSRP